MLHIHIYIMFHIHSFKCETLRSSPMLGTRRTVNCISQKSDAFITPWSYVRPLTVWCHSKWHAISHYLCIFLRGYKNLAFKSSQWNPAPLHRKKKKIGINIESSRNLNLKVFTDFAGSKKSGGRMPSSYQSQHPPVLLSSLLWPSKRMSGAERFESQPSLGRSSNTDRITPCRKEQNLLCWGRKRIGHHTDQYDQVSHLLQRNSLFYTVLSLNSMLHTTSQLVVPKKHVSLLAPVGWLFLHTKQICSVIYLVLILELFIILFSWLLHH